MQFSSPKPLSILRAYLAVLLSVLAGAIPAFAQSTSPAYLQQAFYGVNTLQSWYTPSNGLYQTTGWWNAANAITVLANYSRLDATNAYYPTFANTLQQGAKVNPGFVDGYYDDNGWWALAWIDVYDVTQQPQYLAQAQSIFTNMTGAWDNTCGGGIWWNTDRQYKNAIANELFLSVAAELAARSTGSQQSTYLDWAQREWTWFRGSGMINSQNLINDGLTTATCQNNGQKTWSYNQGVILGGLTQLSALTHDSTLIPQAQTIADAAVAHLTDSNGILTDTCEPNCGQDGVQFKGVFLRNLMALQAAVHNPAYTTFADNNAESIWNKSQGPNYQFGQAWAGPFDVGSAGSQSSALDAFLAAASMQPGAIGSPGGTSAPSFTLSASPATLNLTGGASATATVTLAPKNGFSGVVALTATVVGAPTGIQASLGSSSLSGTGSTNLTITTTSAAPGGSYLVAVTGISAGLAQTAYITVTFPDFALSPAATTIYLNQGSEASDPLTETTTNGFNGAIDYALSTLPPEITGSFSTNTLDLYASLFAPTTSGRSFTLTATSGSTVHTLPPLTVAVSAAASDRGRGTPVNLAPSFNITALRSDGTPFSDGGLDGVGSAYSANLLGPARVLYGIRYSFGAPDAPDAIYGAGQTIALPQGRYTALQLLGTGTGGNQLAQPLTVTYTDGTSTAYTQGFSDWYSPGPNPNEDQAVAMPYRNTSTGQPQQIPFNIYGYTLELNGSKTVQSLTLPNNRNVLVLAATLSAQNFGRSVNLQAAYNATGIYTDGSTFPQNGGVDGAGYAYSANLLGTTPITGADLVVGPSHFHIAPANQPNVVYGAGQTIPLPPGFYQSLELLGTGVEGNQLAQAITLNFYDGSSETITQNWSDWFSFGQFANESEAIRTPYRLTYSGAHPAQAFNIYQYTYRLNPLKPVKSLTLPNNRGVVLLGITLNAPFLTQMQPFTSSPTPLGSAE